LQANTIRLQADASRLQFNQSIFIAFRLQIDADTVQVVR
jgi:hypothetical protein